MLTHCWFDMLDICLSFDIYGTIMEVPNGHDHVVLPGTYIFPAGFNPLGYTAEQLFPYAAKIEKQYA